MTALMFQRLRRLACAALVAAPFGTAVAQAETVGKPVVVVELYTSQGCSSCPPADAYLDKLSNRGRVLPLALHVDYWDYLGWKDKFATARFTQRQHAYANAIGSHMVYTPQMIVAGAERVEGNNPPKVDAIVAAHLKAKQPVDLTISRENDRLEIRATTKKPFADALLVQIVRFDPEETVAIERGENAGKSINYRNIVTEWRTVAEWSGTAPLDLTETLAGAGPVVVIVQKPGPSDILAAAVIN